MLKQAVLFDLDGTLHDSEVVWHEAFAALAARYFRNIEPGQLAGLEGLSATAAVRIFHRRLDLQMENARVDVNWLERHVADSLLGRPHWYPGALQLVRDIRLLGLPTALVTSSGKLIIASLLAGLHEHLFDTVVSGDDVENPKPAADPYLLAAYRLEVMPANCLVVEDSLTGVDSALAAGCKVVKIGEQEQPTCKRRVLVVDRSKISAALLTSVLADS